MEQKKSKIVHGDSGLDEVWTAGGPVWINFANTMALASRGMADVTGSSDTFLWWFRSMGLQPPVALTSKDLLLACELRESLQRISDQFESRVSIAAKDLELFNSVLAKQHEWYELDHLSTGIVVKNIRRSVDTIEQAMGPIMDSLVKTLVEGDPTRLRTCAHPDCVLKFYDDSKNGTRRWCTMSGCGNRAKAAAFLKRKKLP